MKKIPLGIGLLSLISTPAISNQQEEEKELPNILWINCEDVSPNWGCYGDMFATTPNIDLLASKGIVFDLAFAPASISTPSRSTLITGIYATSLGTQHLRSTVKRPEFIETLPEILAKNGYFTSNNGKTDYNFDASKIWEYTKNDNAPWRQRKDKQPFFSMFTFGMTHEGSTNYSKTWARNTKDLPDSLFHNPGNTPLPPYYPDTPEMRKIWAHYYDNITVFDQTVGEIIKNISKDGLSENTIVFVFSDHGAGLPRYKRWLYDTGLHVPFVAYVPKKFKHLLPAIVPGTHTRRMVNFSDFSPTVLSLTGISIPGTMEGSPFMGHTIGEPRWYTIGTRSRADNMFDMSLAIRTDRYIYIRHYHPEVPYIQPGAIFYCDKESLVEFHRLKEKNLLNDLQLKMYQTKETEELFDLENDPYELNNLAKKDEYKSLVAYLHKIMLDWAIEHRSTDFIHEAEYMNQAMELNISPYELTHSKSFPIIQLINAAEFVGVADINQCSLLLNDENQVVRYWGLIALQSLGAKAGPIKGEIRNLLKDKSPVVQITAAQTLYNLEEYDEPLSVLGRNLLDERPWVALYAARAIELMGSKATPLVPIMKQVLNANKKIPGQVSGHRIYKNYDFAAFTGWSLERALLNCGETVEITQ